MPCLLPRIALLPSPSFRLRLSCVWWELVPILPGGSEPRESEFLGKSEFLHQLFSSSYNYLTLTSRQTLSFTSVCVCFIVQFFHFPMMGCIISLWNIRERVRLALEYTWSWKYLGTLWYSFFPHTETDAQWLVNRHLTCCPDRPFIGHGLLWSIWKFSSPVDTTRAGKYLWTQNV